MKGIMLLGASAGIGAILIIVAILALIFKVTRPILGPIMKIIGKIFAGLLIVSAVFYIMPQLILIAIPAYILFLVVFKFKFGK